MIPTASKTALNLAQTSLKAQDDFETFAQPHVKEWLKIEILHNRLNEDEVKADFTLTEYDEEEEALTFQSHEEEIYIGFRDYETIQANSVFIPLGFFDNPEKYFLEAREAKALREKEALQQEADRKRALIKRLEDQLAQVKATQAELDKLKTTN